MKQILLRKRNILILLIPVALLLSEWAKSSAYVAEEIFATRIYKGIAQAMGMLTGWVPFSLAELVIVVGPVVILVLLIRQLVRAVRAKEGKVRFTVLMTALQNLLCLIGVIFFVYTLLCGINYHRYPVNYYLGLPVQESSVEELEGLLIELADTASGLRATLMTEDERGVYVLPMTVAELGKEAKEAYVSLSGEYGIFAGHYPVPKPVFFSRLMSYTEITGVFTCWTMEANVNVDISPYSIGATMCHELAHLRGFMREDEANFISCMACRASDSKDLQYSGAMLSLIYVGNALYGQDAERYFAVYREHYSDAVIRDLVANNEYWKQFEKTVIAETAEKVNDTYLKANDQEDGTKSYGRVVDLLLAEYRKKACRIKNIL